MDDDLEPGDSSQDGLEPQYDFGPQDDDDLEYVYSSDESSSDDRSIQTTYGPMYVPVPIVSIAVKGGQVFHLHKDILTMHSAYFKAALDGLFVEAQTQSIDLDDIEPEHFGLYASLLYPTTVLVDPVSLDDVWIPNNMNRWPWTDLLRLWQLADRFINNRIKRIAKHALDERFEELSVRTWMGRYKNRSWSYIKEYVAQLNCAFVLCKDENLPFQGYFIKGLGSSPPQVLAECVKLLDDDLRVPVTERFALRFADREVTLQKRAKDEERETREAKKQKRNE